MRRPWQLILTASLAAIVAVSPTFAPSAHAADPTVTVRPGDTLTGIARRTGIPVTRLAELNGLSNPNRIYVGQRLRVGTERSGAGPSARRVVHVVNRGTTLWHIARRYGVSVSAIVAANGLANPSRIFAGQRLVIPGASAPRSSSGGSGSRPAARVVHVVNRGSTVWHIARRYGVSVSAIVAANGLANPSRIFAGQRLVIPGASAPRSSAGAAAPGRSSVPPSIGRLMGSRDTVRRIIIREADRYGVPRAFALAVAWQESGWQQGVVSHAGAVGVMQLMPGTATWIGETMLGRRVNMYDTRSNIRAGVRLLRHYLDRYAGNRDLVLAAYYQGQRAVDRHGIYPVSRPYIGSIRAIERMLGGG